MRKKTFRQYYDGKMDKYLLNAIRQANASYASEIVRDWAQYKCKQRLLAYWTTRLQAQQYSVTPSDVFISASHDAVCNPVRILKYGTQQKLVCGTVVTGNICKPFKLETHAKWRWSKAVNMDSEEPFSESEVETQLEQQFKLKMSFENWFDNNLSGDYESKDLTSPATKFHALASPLYKAKIDGFKAKYLDALVKNEIQFHVTVADWLEPYEGKGKPKIVLFVELDDIPKDLHGCIMAAKYASTNNIPFYFNRVKQVKYFGSKGIQLSANVDPVFEQAVKGFIPKTSAEVQSLKKIFKGKFGYWTMSIDGVLSFGISLKVLELRSA